MPEMTFQDKVLKRADELSRKIVDRALQNTPQAPGMKKMTTEEQLAQYESLTPEALQGLVAKRGEVAVNHYVARMEALKARRVPDGTS